MPKLQLGRAACPRSSCFVVRGSRAARRLRGLPDEAELRSQAREHAGAWSQGGQRILMSGDFSEQMPDMKKFTDLGEHTLKGKTQTVRAFGLVE